MRFALKRTEKRWPPISNRSNSGEVKSNGFKKARSSTDKVGRCLSAGTRIEIAQTQPLAQSQVTSPMWNVIINFGMWKQSLFSSISLGVIRGALTAVSSRAAAATWQLHSTMRALYRWRTAGDHARKYYFYSSLMRGRKIKPSRKEEGPRSTIAKHAVFFEATNCNNSNESENESSDRPGDERTRSQSQSSQSTVASAVRAPRKIKTHASRRVGWGEEGGDLNDFIVEPTFWVELAAAEYCERWELLKLLWGQKNTAWKEFRKWARNHSAILAIIYALICPQVNTRNTDHCACNRTYCSAVHVRLLQNFFFEWIHSCKL